MMSNKIHYIIDKLENADIQIVNYVMAFFFIVLTRGFLETLLIEQKLIQVKELLIHYPLFFLALLVSIGMLLAVLSKQNISRVFKILIPFYIIIIVPPLLDTIIFGVGNYSLGYVLSPQSTIGDVLRKMFTFYGYPLNAKVTLGIRIEIILGMTGAFFYIWLKSHSILKAIISAFGVYLLTFFYLAAPFFKGLLMKAVMLIGFSERSAYMGISTYFLFLLVIQLPILVYIWNKRKSIAIIRNIRLYRIAHFWSMLFLGLWIGLSGRLSLIVEMNFFDIVCGFGMVLFAYLFSEIIDNIDSISNTEHRTAIRDLSKMETVYIAVIYFTLGILCAGMIEMRLVFLYLVFCGIYWIYSIPPLRVKKIPILATALIALDSLIPILVGLTMTGKYTGRLLSGFALGLFVIFTLAFNVKDLKSCESDKKNGIATLMTILGEKVGRKVIGLLTGISYAFVPFFIRLHSFIFIIVSLTFGVFTYLAITNRIINEKGMFLVYFIFLITISVFWEQQIRQLIININ
ncbi:UbiA prenyltransferase family protein [bacterium]|nr:UbiA prenyltransferase family protein [bacterium]